MKVWTFRLKKSSNLPKIFRLTTLCTGFSVLFGRKNKYSIHVSKSETSLHIVLFCRNIFFSLLADSFHILPSNNLQIETNITTSQIPTIIHCLGKIASKHGEETYPLHSNAFRWEYTFDLKGTWKETMIFSKVVFTVRYTKTNNCPHFFCH